MQFRSLRAQLLAWLLLPLLASIATNTALSFRDAETAARQQQDERLLGSVRIIAEQVRTEDGVVVSETPPAALELFEASPDDRVYYRVSSPDGSLVNGSPEVPLPAASLAIEEPVFFDASVREQGVRIAAFAQPLLALGARGYVVIEVAQTMHTHRRFVRTLMLHDLLQQSLLLALVIMLTLIGLHRGLRPLMRLRDRVVAREPGAVEPLDAGTPPRELEPLVDAMNDYARRLDAHASTQARFVANAAHQLRTPITVLATQVDYALRSVDPATREETLQAIQKSVQHGTRIVQQLLTLSVAEVQATRAAPGQQIDLKALAQEVLEQAAGRAQARRIDLGFDAPQAVPPIVGQRAMLHELVSNLVDNALRYTQPEGVVTVMLRAADGRVVLRVEDNGPGIPPQEHERVFERFYRLSHADSDGCGLGLAIVREIAALHHAEVSLGEREGGGLAVEVAFAGS